MNTKQIAYYLAILITFLFVEKNLMAQTNLAEAKKQKLIEQIWLTTDRQIYCAEESILFSIYNNSARPMQRNNWSQVVYIDLLTPDGEIIEQQKLDYTQEASGKIKLPRWMLTGNYYLRAYTRWMRNFPSQLQDYKMVSIINPFRQELLESNGQQIIKDTNHSSTKYTPAVEIETTKHNYIQREQVTVDYTIAAPDYQQGSVVATVVRKGTEQSTKLSGINATNNATSSEFIPETRGVSVSGTVVNEPDSLPLPYTLVGLTVFKDNPENLNLLTNENGRFFFDLGDLKGNYELFISSKGKEEGVHPLILVDNDFEARLTTLPFVPIDFSPRNRELYETLSFTSQMHQLYQEQQAQKQAPKHQEETVFYGTPDFSLDFDAYIELPSVEEYLHELVPRVRVKKNHTQKNLTVTGADPELSIYTPLVLIDMVSVFDTEKILALDPKRLKKMEVISQPYIRGDITYGGIISFFSRKGDLAGLDLPSAGRFISYKLLAETQTTFQTELPGERIPDLRNCLFWSSDLNTDKQGTGSFSFHTGDNTGTYLIILQGINQNGKAWQASHEIQIQ